MTVEPYWTDGVVTLYCGDAREVLPSLGVVADLIVTDPPYEETGLAWDAWPQGWLDASAATARTMWAFLPLRQFAAPPFRGQEFHASGWRLSQDIVWEKNAGSGMATDRFRRVHEIATFWYRGNWNDLFHQAPRVAHLGPRQGTAARTASGMDHRSGGRNGTRAGWIDDGTRLQRSVVKAQNLRGRAIHPTEKPPGVLTPMLQYACPPGGLVIDPFAGSCSTLSAARALGMRAIGVELREEQCERAVVGRLSQAELPLDDGGAA